MQILENDEPILQRVAPLDVGLSIIDYDKLHRFFKEDECPLFYDIDDDVNALIPL